MESRICLIPTGSTAGRKGDWRCYRPAAGGWANSFLCECWMGRMTPLRPKTTRKRADARVWWISGCEAPASLDCRGRTDAQVSRAQHGFNPLSGAAFTAATAGGGPRHVGPWFRRPSGGGSPGGVRSGQPANERSRPRTGVSGFLRRRRSPAGSVEKPSANADCAKA